MMKRNILAVVIPALLVAGAANAAEVYNKDGNKVDIYGKAVGLHYFSKHNGDNAYAPNGDQREALFNAIAAYASNIENLPALLPAVEKIAHRCLLRRFAGCGLCHFADRRP